MNTEIISVEAQCLTKVDRLDTIYVFWQNLGDGKGHVTITCFGSAWTAYFGGMGNQTVQIFFARADIEYLVTKMGITPHLKANKRDHAYLARIILAVKDSIDVRTSSEPCKALPAV